MCTARITLSLVLMMVLAGCRHTAEMEIPPDLRIVFGQQGTFAGRSTGYSINAAGEVVQWEGKYPEEIRQATATVDRRQVRKLWQQAEEIRFLEMSEQSMATINWFITVSARGESRRVTWGMRDENAPCPAQELFDEAMAVAKTALQEQR